ncbi:MAG: glycosyltransferase, partial [Alphaproteobacteria bacterium]
VWELFEDYFGPDRVGAFKRAVISFFANYLRVWDVASAERVDYFIANSRHVARRIAKHYHREAAVIHPPVDTARFQIAEPEDFYLVVSALAPYKRVDLAVAACAKLGRKLKVVGTGQDTDRLQKLGAAGVEFLGWQSDEAVADLYRRCKAFLFPGEEDFGITPVEAQASGRPVIAFGKGGALETVCGLDREKPTGVFFTDQSVAGLCAAIEQFEANENKIDPQAVREHALAFDREVFRNKLREQVEKYYASYQSAEGPVR